jgi:hypothetical protein
MSSFFSLVLSPFTMVLRVAQYRPWITIPVALGLGTVAGFTHHEIWMGFLLCFGAYMLMWLDMQENTELAALGSGDNVE